MLRHSLHRVLLAEKVVYQPDEMFDISEKNSWQQEHLGTHIASWDTAINVKHMPWKKCNHSESTLSSSGHLALVKPTVVRLSSLCDQATIKIYQAWQNLIFSCHQAVSKKLPKLMKGHQSVIKLSTNCWQAVGSISINIGNNFELARWSLQSISECVSEWTRQSNDRTKVW